MGIMGTGCSKKKRSSKNGVLLNCQSALKTKQNSIF